MDCSVSKSCPTLCNPMECSTPVFTVLHYLLEFAQTHIYRVGDAIQPSYPLLSPSPPAFNLSQGSNGEGNGTHSSTLAWKIQWTEEPGRLQSMGSLRVGHDRETSLSLFTFMHWRRKWQPTPAFLPGESQGWGSLVGCRRWGRAESDTTDVAEKKIKFIINYNSNTLLHTSW